TLGARRQPNRLRTRGDVLRMDDVDRRIIALLGADARASYAEIGTQVALSAPAVKRRVDRLRASGVIKGFTAVLDPAAIGWTTERCGDTGSLRLAAATSCPELMSNLRAATRPLVGAYGLGVTDLNGTLPGGAPVPGAAAAAPKAADAGGAGGGTPAYSGTNTA